MCARWDEVPTWERTDTISCLQPSLSWAVLYLLATFKAVRSLRTMDLQVSQGGLKHLFLTAGTPWQSLFESLLHLTGQQ